LKNNEPDYFLGLIVLVEPSNGGAWQILDGQQRLATATMVYSSIRSWLFENGFEKDAQKVQERYIVPERKPRIFGSRPLAGGYLQSERFVQIEKI
jgi:hypothetical protein